MTPSGWRSTKAVAASRHARWLDIGRGHAPRDVEGEDDDAVVARQADRRLGPSESDDG
jgi:hypothetical protein